MAEIDFDELDKAVSSLMENVNKPKRQSAPEVSDASADSSQNSDDKEQSQPSDESRETEQKTQPNDTDSTSDLTKSVDTSAEEQDSEPPKRPLANKRRGQFMDMKHASADMRVMPVAKPPMSRIGTSLSPISSGVKSDDEKTEEPQTPQAHPADVPSEDYSENSESSGVLSESQTTSTNSTDDSEEVTSERTSQKTDEDTDLPTSPFLSGAKVEKRPLGAPAPAPKEDSDIDAAVQSEQNTDAPEEETLSHTVELSSATESVAPAVSPTKLPKELDASVLEVEADTTAIDGKAGDEAKQEQFEDDEQPHDMSAETTKSDSKKSDDAAQPSEAYAPASIPMQYKAKQPGDDTLSAQEPQTSMYDTAVDHPTLAQPKKTSHWAIVIGIIIFVLLGALAGAALYLYQTGTLSLV